MSEEKKQPIQPLIVDQYGTQRFQANEIVRYLLDNGGIDMNQLAGKEFPQADREQFAQLIGYSLSGFGELSYVRDATYETAANMGCSDLSEKNARIKYLEGVIAELRPLIKQIAPLLFRIHPDDLQD